MEAENKSEGVPKIKYKSYTYRTQLEWLGGRAGSLAAEGKPGFRVASPPEFKGEAGVWCPEDLFVASVNVCTMTTFAAFLGRLQLPVVSYNCEAEGLLEFVEGKYCMTRVTLRPRVVVKSAEAIAPTEKALHDAHDNCIISNSMKSTVILEPEVTVQST
jgi:organic hydroperoxide reductase OsmC/OhrA